VADADSCAAKARIKSSAAEVLFFERSKKANYQDNRNNPNAEPVSGGICHLVIRPNGWPRSNWSANAINNGPTIELACKLIYIHPLYSSQAFN
jgi:hypothetical protein